MVALKFAAAWVVLVGQVALAQASAVRPPQFVVMAFDNCAELERWQELAGFAADMNRDADRVRFTFFVSATNFVADGKRGLYEGPRVPRGTSRMIPAFRAAFRRAGNCPLRPGIASLAAGR